MLHSTFIPTLILEEIILLDWASRRKNDVGPDTDFAAVDEGYVSITPLHVDLTAYKALDLLQNWLNKAEVKKTC